MLELQTKDFSGSQRTHLRFNLMIIAISKTMGKLHSVYSSAYTICKCIITHLECVCACVCVRAHARVLKVAIINIV